MPPVEKIQKGAFYRSCRKLPTPPSQTKPHLIVQVSKNSKKTKRPLTEPRLCYNQLKEKRQRKEESKMRKRIAVAVLMAALACIALVGCGAKKPVEPLDLTGNSEEKDTSDGYQAGYISMFRNPFGRVRSSCSARRFRPENWTERHELSRASLSNRWHQRWLAYRSR